MSTLSAPKIVKMLTAERGQFLRFLMSRVECRETAEDILQASLVKALERGSEIRDQESILAWFYRLLRNALTDHHRRSVSSVRILKTKAKRSPETNLGDLKLERAVCHCLRRIIPTLKGPYAEILERVELEGQSIADFCRSKRITPNTALVRLHRARKALQVRLLKDCCGVCRETGCLDCTCPT